MTFYMKVNIPCCVVSFARPGCGGTDAFVRASEVFLSQTLPNSQTCTYRVPRKKRSHNEVLIIYCFRVLDVPVICRILGGGEDRNVAAVNGKQLRPALLA
jgi:hypothetical protein